MMTDGAASVELPEPRRTDHLSVGIVLADRFTISAFALFVDHLRLAADDEDRSRQQRLGWEIFGGVSAPARASCGVTVSCTLRYPDPARFDYLVVVGGLLGPGDQVSDDCIAFLQSAARAGVTLAGLCTGSFILCRAGLMTGRRCCVSWFHYHDFLAEFPHHLPIADRIYVDDGDRITCSGGAGVADVAQHIIGRHFGRSLAQKSSHVLIAPPSGTGFQPHPPALSTARDERVRRALLVMEQNLGEPLDINCIADRLRMSRRQLERLFHAEFEAAPWEVYLRLRLGLAHYLLKHSDRPVADIALEAGFPNASHFTKKFKAEYGCLPSDLRGVSEMPAGDARAGQRIF